MTTISLYVVAMHREKPQQASHCQRTFDRDGNLFHSDTTPLILVLSVQQQHLFLHGKLLCNLRQRFQVTPHKGIRKHLCLIPRIAFWNIHSIWLHDQGHKPATDL